MFTGKLCRLKISSVNTTLQKFQIGYFFQFINYDFQKPERKV